jgi:ArsR family metal-binding transcriptional regulator
MKVKTAIKRIEKATNKKFSTNERNGILDMEIDERIISIYPNGNGNAAFITVERKNDIYDSASYYRSIKSVVERIACNY